MSKLFTAFLLTVSLVYAQGSSFVDYIKIQHAGNIGFGAIGVGKSFFNQEYELELFYGYVPSSIAEVSIHVASIKNNYIPYRFNFLESEIAPYIGLSLIHMLDKEYFANEKEDVPINYYHVTGVHLTSYAGILLKYENDDVQIFSVYFEAGILDAYAINYFSNSRYLDFQDIVSLALGIGYHF